MDLEEDALQPENEGFFFFGYFFIIHRKLNFNRQKCNIERPPNCMQQKFNKYQHKQRTQFINPNGCTQTIRRKQEK